MGATATVLTAVTHYRTLLIQLIVLQLIMRRDATNGIFLYTSLNMITLREGCTRVLKIEGPCHLFIKFQIE